VLGLEGDAPVISFVYQLTSHSLVPVVFRFAVELTVYLPGVPSGEARFAGGKTVQEGLKYARFTVAETRSWQLTDQQAGFGLEFTTQKPVDLWCFPATAGTAASATYQGTTLVISSVVSLTEGTPWKLMGKMECTKGKSKAKRGDAC
jgi:hypothetical protein